MYQYKIVIKIITETMGCFGQADGPSGRRVCRALLESIAKPVLNTYLHHDGAECWKFHTEVDLR